MNACINGLSDVINLKQNAVHNFCSKCGLKLVKMAYEMDQDKSLYKVVQDLL